VGKDLLQDLGVCQALGKVLIEKNMVHIPCENGVMANTEDTLNSRYWPPPGTVVCVGRKMASFYCALPLIGLNTAST
jgi:hypothetical protein